MAAPTAKEEATSNHLVSADRVPLSSHLSKIYDPLSKADPRSAKDKSKVSMVELAKIIARESEKLEKYLVESGSELPGFDVNSPVNFPILPVDVKRSREEIIRATKELGDLVTGPTESVRWMAWDVRTPESIRSPYGLINTDPQKHNNSLSLHAIYHYKIGKILHLSRSRRDLMTNSKILPPQFNHHLCLNRLEDRSLRTQHPSLPAPCNDQPYLPRTCPRDRSTYRILARPRRKCSHGCLARVLRRRHVARGITHDRRARRAPLSL